MPVTKGTSKKKKVEEKPTNDPCKMRIVRPTDQEYLRFLAKKLADIPEFWEDRMRYDIYTTFSYIFAGPNSFVVDLDGDGVLAFVADTIGYRAFTYAANWGPKASRIPESRRQAVTSAMAAKDLLFIEAITRYDNMPARKAMENMGAVFRGRLPGRLWYNGEPMDGALYEFHRNQTGLDPLE